MFVWNVYTSCSVDVGVALLSKVL